MSEETALVVAEAEPEVEDEPVRDEDSLYLPPNVPKGLIVWKDNKPVITFPGLLVLLHQATRGQFSMVNAVEKDEGGEVVVLCVLKGKRLLEDGKTLVDFHVECRGDASQGNVGPLTKNAIKRMAETRAMARCCRVACNVGLVAAEEMAEGDPSAARSRNNERREEAPPSRVNRQPEHVAAPAPTRGAPPNDAPNTGDPKEVYRDDAGNPVIAGGKIVTRGILQEAMRERISEMNSLHISFARLGEGAALKDIATFCADAKAKIKAKKDAKPDGGAA